VFKLIVKKVEGKGLMEGGVANAKLEWCFLRELLASWAKEL
jgi:hypothetical protein